MQRKIDSKNFLFVWYKSQITHKKETIPRNLLRLPGDQEALTVHFSPSNN